MKRTFERIGFMLVGALLVCVAYLVGKADQTADAQFQTFQNVVIKRNLLVEGSLLVSTKKGGIESGVLIDASNGASIFLTSENVNRSKADKATVSIAAKDRNGVYESFINLFDKDTKGFTMSSRKGWNRVDPDKK